MQKLRAHESLKRGWVLRAGKHLANAEARAPKDDEMDVPAPEESALAAACMRLLRVESSVVPEPLLYGGKKGGHGEG